MTPQVTLPVLEDAWRQSSLPWRSAPGARHWSASWRSCVRDWPGTAPDQEGFRAGPANAMERLTARIRSAYLRVGGQRAQRPRWTPTENSAPPATGDHKQC